MRGGGRLTLSESGFDLHALLSGLEEMFGVQARRKGLDLPAPHLRGRAIAMREDDGADAPP